jgi:hypothetical protein
MVKMELIIIIIIIVIKIPDATLHQIRMPVAANTNGTTSPPSMQSSVGKGSRLDHHNETNVVLEAITQTQINNTIQAHPTFTAATSI